MKRLIAMPGAFAFTVACSTAPEMATAEASSAKPNEVTSVEKTAAARLADTSAVRVTYREVTLPAGHFGLAVQDYTHSTAPNRRYADLVTQRLVKCVLAGVAPAYTEVDLAEIARACTLRETDARKVARTTRKEAADH